MTRYHVSRVRPIRHVRRPRWPRVLARLVPLAGYVVAVSVLLARWPGLQVLAIAVPLVFVLAFVWHLGRMLLGVGQWE